MRGQDRGIGLLGQSVGGEGAEAGGAGGSEGGGSRRGKDRGSWPFWEGSPRDKRSSCSAKPRGVFWFQSYAPWGGQ